MRSPQQVAVTRDPSLRARGIKTMHLSLAILNHLTIGPFCPEGRRRLPWSDKCDDSNCANPLSRDLCPCPDRDIMTRCRAPVEPSVGAGCLLRCDCSQNKAP